MSIINLICVLFDWNNGLFRSHDDRDEYGNTWTLLMVCGRRKKGQRETNVSRFDCVVDSVNDLVIDGNHCLRCFLYRFKGAETKKNEKTSMSSLAQSLVSRANNFFFISFFFSYFAKENRWRNRHQLCDKKLILSVIIGDFYLFSSSSFSSSNDHFLLHLCTFWFHHRWRWQRLRFFFCFCWKNA